MYELLPLWHAFFTKLGFRVEVSGLSTRRIYEKGQFSIPSDTACYPAKIMHGHMETLLERNVDASSPAGESSVLSRKSMAYSAAP